jgi:hypothetical protein
MVPPLWKMSIHRGHESVVVMPFNKVRQFVNDEVLETLHGILGEL